MAAPFLSVLGAHLVLNLLLQILDGLITYQVLFIGIPEWNPIAMGAIEKWGVGWGLVYLKTFASVMLLLLFALRHGRRSLIVKLFTVTSAIYGCVTLAGLYHLCVHFVA